MGRVSFKDGTYLVYDPSGAGEALLHAILIHASENDDVVITSAGDSHTPTDPHTLGRAFDLRTHGLTDDQKKFLLRDLLLHLSQSVGMDSPFEMTIPDIWYALATTKWFGQIENYGGPAEHAHLQLRNGISYP